MTKRNGKYLSLQEQEEGGGGGKELNKFLRDVIKTRTVNTAMARMPYKF